MARLSKISQSTLEYMIIVSVVILLGVIAVALIRPSTGSALSGNERISDMAIAAQDVGILSYTVSMLSTEITLVNNYGIPISVTGISFDDVVCDSTRFPATFGPNQNKIFSCSNIVSLANYSYYEYDVQVNVTVTDTNITKTGFIGSISGYTIPVLNP